MKKCLFSGTSVHFKIERAENEGLSFQEAQMRHFGSKVLLSLF